MPAMERFLGEEEHKAHATAIAVILPYPCSRWEFISGKRTWRSLEDCALGIGGGTGRRLCRGEAAAACQRCMGCTAFRGIHACGGSEDVFMILAVIGFVSGIISGMGIGGGAILIPALVMLTDLSQQSIQGINLIILYLRP